MRSPRQKEALVYIIIWTLVFAMVPIAMYVRHIAGEPLRPGWRDVFHTWGSILPYLVLFLIHELAIVRLLERRKGWYLGLTVLLLAAFGVFCFFTGMPHGPGLDGPGGPPPGMGGPPPGPGGPPPGMPHGTKRPLDPEIMRIVIGVLVIVANLGVKAFFRARNSEQLLKEMKDAEKTNREDSCMFFRAGNRTVKVDRKDIRYVESMSEYLKIHLAGQDDPLIVLYSLKRLTEELPEGQFARIHRSYLVNLSRVVEAGTASVTLDDGTPLPIGEIYRTAFRKLWPVKK